MGNTLMLETAMSEGGEPTNWYDRAGLIYFVVAGSPPVSIKIGVTQRKTLLRRLRAIQSSNHEPIRLLRIIEFNDGPKPLHSAEKREREIHKKFANLRLRKGDAVGHEWFKPAPELFKFIEAEGSMPDCCQKTLPDLLEIQRLFGHEDSD